VNRRKPRAPDTFVPPRVEISADGVAAFHNYDWYYRFMRSYLSARESVYLVPCAATKPIHRSPAHVRIYQRFAEFYGGSREILVVSEPVVLIRYGDLSALEDAFCYDFPPRLLNAESRALFVARLRELLDGKDVAGCLPAHHQSLVREAIGNRWENHWESGLYQMMKYAKSL